MIAAVDTSIFLDVLLLDPEHKNTSQVRLERGIREGSLIICEIVYSELSATFSGKQELDRFLEDLGVILKPSTQESLYKAGETWREYLKRRGNEIQCPACGNKMKVICNK